MTIEVACQCGKRFAAPPHLGGKRVKCPSCGLPMSVPTPRSPASIAVPSASPTPDSARAGNPASASSINCKCGARLKVNEDLAGRTVKCPKCCHPLAVPPAEQDSVTAQGLANWFDEQLIDRQPVSSAPSSTQEPTPQKSGVPCPRCHEPLNAGFCVACGYEDTTQRYLKVAFPKDFEIMLPFRRSANPALTARGLLNAIDQEQEPFASQRRRGRLASPTVRTIVSY